MVELLECLCTTGVGCAIGAPLAGVSAYGGVNTASDGKDSLFGSYKSEVGQDVLNSFSSNRKDQLSPLTKDALNGALTVAEAVLLAKVGGKLSTNVKHISSTAEVKSALGKNLGTFNAVNPGSLSNDLAKTFAGGKYTVFELEHDKILYRAGKQGTELL